MKPGGRLTAAALLGAALLPLGCAHVPPSNVTRDRFDYAEALSQSWKRQTLMNVVHLRYADAPFFLDVTSLINTYTRTNNVTANASLRANWDDSSLGASASGTWTNSPTITYQPVSGDKFAKQLLRPIPPASLLQMMEAGWPARVMLPVTVRSVNGLRGQVLGRVADPEFDQLVESLDRIQQSDGLGFRISAAKPGENVLLVLSEDREEVRADQENVRQLLKLDPGLKEVEVAFGSVRQNRSEIAMVTRSMLEIMLEVSAGIDVPEAHREEGRVLPMGVGEAGRPRAEPLMRIRSGAVAPADAYAAIRYKQHAFWIDDRDLRSKRLFSFLMLLFSLAESGQPSAAPLVTISK